MNIPILYQTLAYFIFVVIFVSFSALGIYHLRRFGYAGDLTKPIIFIYSLVSLTVIVISVIMIIYESYI